MSVSIWVIVGTAVGVTAPVVGWHLRGRFSGKPGRFPGKGNRPAKPAGSKYAAVKIETDLMSCAAVESYRGTRYLPEEAPTLPVPGCDQAHCKCKFKHFDDRRSNVSRRLPFSQLQGAWGLAQLIEKRKINDRRRAKEKAAARAYFNDHDA